MGDPKYPRKAWRKPKRPLNYDLKMEELKTLGTYGLRTKKELWKAHADGQTSEQQQQVFCNPSPVEEFYDVGKDPNQLVNLANNPEYSSEVKKARKFLDRWIDQTGDSIPKKSTASRNKPSRIENGKVVPLQEVEGARKMRGEMPGASKNAMKMNHPGPIFIDEKLLSFVVPFTNLV